MGSRVELHAILKEIVGAEGKVYFQPPEDVSMVYPCIVYSRSELKVSFAENSPYRLTKRYAATVIDPNPDSLIPDKLALLPMTTFSRHFKSANLNHDTYNIYY